MARPGGPGHLGPARWSGPAGGYSVRREPGLYLMDGGRGFGTGRLLPAGPLREPVSRLARVDAVVVNGDAAPPDLPAHPRCFHMRLQPGALYQLSQPASTTVSLLRNTMYRPRAAAAP